MRIAFCTTCKGRVQHLARTLPTNLKDSAAFRDAVFVVLDYHDPGDVQSYLKDAHAPDIESGRLVVYSYLGEEPFVSRETRFRMAHAKNMAHRLGIMERADILVNMDADNFAAPGFAEWLERQFEIDIDLTLVWANAKSVIGRARQGLAGRTAVSRNLFLKLGGFDEKYIAWAPEDEDFKSRAKRIATRSIRVPNDFLYVIPHKDGVRFREYPDAKPTPEREAESLRSIRSATHVIANHGRAGLGTVFRNFDISRPITVGAVPTRIFGIGMHKTGTTSLHSAFRTLGFHSFHWDRGDLARQIWDEMTTLGRSITLERYYALCDLPIPMIYRELDTAYPGSKFILTIREESRWLESVRKHWTYDHNKTRWEWDVYPFTNRIHKALYGRTDFDAETFLARYRRHNAEVRRYFGARADLLVMDMDRGDGWPELCNFLECPIPAAPYPHAFKTFRRRHSDIEAYDGFGHGI